MRSALVLTRLRTWCSLRSVRSAELLNHSRRRLLRSRRARLRAVNTVTSTTLKHGDASVERGCVIVNAADAGPSTAARLSGNEGLRKIFGETIWYSRRRLGQSRIRVTVARFSDDITAT
ncbi:hypothetical protein PHSY_001946 [Pseudozyma hubeiensis SY62]|uniref:Uncharacterized protein n=1 Tax=Pseudozyma hubeiensis (strain SY62) TaxID=1305764 RepID=R9P8I4_PSEHS|nr:hypothetical protein PHSY_001946 [Pseudozyma hubeiensis SY62]GAC94375.1 hypothetical protein PHSY_001946 [Pseudozyma hubeiensis SY62]